MNYIDHPLLYTDNYGSTEWSRLCEVANISKKTFWRRYARRKMRRAAKELLRGTRPRIYLGY